MNMMLYTHNSLHVKSRQSGLTLVEILGALAVGAGLILFMIQIISNMTQSQYSVYIQRHHQIVADASSKYVEKYWFNLSSELEMMENNPSRELHFPMSELVSKGFLPSWWPTKNPMGQVPCLLIRRQPSLNSNDEAQLQALLVTEGGRPLLIQNAWTAAGVNGHGVGILDSFISTNGSPAPVTARGFAGQWQESFDPSGQSRLFTGIGCNNASLESGRIATLLTIRDPREIGDLQVVKRNNSNSVHGTTLFGSLGFTKPENGNSLIATNIAPLLNANDVCLSTQDGWTGSTRRGDILVCSRTSSGSYKWLIMNASMLLDRVSSPQFSILKVVTPGDSCTNYSIGELARISNGSLAYCSRPTLISAPSTWVWTKTGGKWKYVKYEQQLAMYSGSSFSFSTPSTARVLQLQFFLEPTDKVLSISMKLPSGQLMPLAKTCCYRSSNISLLSSAYKYGVLDVRSEDNQVSAVWSILTGYIDDDK